MQSWERAEQELIITIFPVTINLWFFCFLGVCCRSGLTDRSLWQRESSHSLLWQQAAHTLKHKYTSRCVFLLQPSVCVAVALCDLCFERYSYSLRLGGWKRFTLMLLCCFCLRLHRRWVIGAYLLKHDACFLLHCLLCEHLLLPPEGGFSFFHQCLGSFSFSLSPHLLLFSPHIPFLSLPCCIMTAPLLLLLPRTSSCAHLLFLLLSCYFSIFCSFCRHPEMPLSQPPHM